MENMIDIGGSVFKIDLKAFSNALVTDEKVNKKATPETNKHIETETNSSFDFEGKPLGFTVTTRECEKPKEIDGPKYDLLRMCLEIIFSYSEEIDDSMGVSKALEGTSIPFKIAFNTLLSYGVLKEIETE